MNIRLLFFVCTTLVCGSSSTSYTRSGEYLVTIPEDIPAHTEIIDLTDNRIARVDSIPHPLPALSEIDLSYNRLTEFPDFTNCSNVSVVTLKGNSITHISADRLNILTRLTHLFLIYNSLQTIPDVPGPGNTLIELSLHGNNFREIPSLQYLGQALQTLNVQRNSITHIPSASLEQLKGLTTLKLDNNQIQGYPNVKSLPANLEEIWLSKNSDLGRLPDGLFPMLPSLKTLNLRTTGMPTIPMDICLRGKLSMRFILLLSGNPIHCDQEMRWLRLAEEAGVDLRDGTCETPDNMAGRTWETVTWEDLSYHGMLLYYLQQKL